MPFKDFEEMVKNIQRMMKDLDPVSSINTSHIEQIQDAFRRIEDMGLNRAVPGLDPDSVNILQEAQDRLTALGLNDAFDASSAILVEQANQRIEELGLRDMYSSMYENYSESFFDRLHKMQNDIEKIGIHGKAEAIASAESMIGPNSDEFEKLVADIHGSRELAAQLQQTLSSETFEFQKRWEETTQLIGSYARISETVKLNAFEDAVRQAQLNKFQELRSSGVFDYIQGYLNDLVRTNEQLEQFYNSDFSEYMELLVDAELEKDPDRQKLIIEKFKGFILSAISRLPKDSIISREMIIHLFVDFLIIYLYVNPMNEQTTEKLDEIQQSVTSLSMEVKDYNRKDISERHYVLIKKTEVYLEPDSESEIASILQPNTPVVLLEVRKGWARVQYSDYVNIAEGVGWISSESIIKMGD